MSSRVSIRSLARELGLSIATVSEALRDSPAVRPETRARVIAAAEAAGYRRNPLVGATFSALRTGRHLGFSGTLALVDAPTGGGQQLIPFHRAIGTGAARRAEALGFRTEVFWVGKRAPNLSVTRLNSVLRARGIQGVIFLPFDQRQEFADFDLNQLAAVSMDHRLVKPELHTIQADHYLSMRRCLDELHARGYRRMGLCLPRPRDERADYKWSSGFISWFRLAGRTPAVPPLIPERLDAETFSQWFEQHRPDVIVSHEEIVVKWTAQAGRKVPRDVGFLRINHSERTLPCAGIDLRPEQLGATAVETVVGMLHRRESGAPSCANSISIDAHFVDGPTLRPAAARG
jgi:LacI family transcriptional regulator